MVVCEHAKEVLMECGARSAPRKYPEMFLLLGNAKECYITLRAKRTGVLLDVISLDIRELLGREPGARRAVGERWGWFAGNTNGMLLEPGVRGCLIFLGIDDDINQKAF